MNIAEYPFEAITFEDKNWLIHPFRAEDVDRFDQMAQQVLQLLSDERTICFIPEKKLLSLEDANLWLQKAVLNYYTGRSYIHFITEKNTGRLTGIIDILSPKFTKEYYTLNDYPYFIEFYLTGNAQGRLLMSNLLPEVILKLRNQGIFFIAAVVNRKNTASKRVLEKAGFRFNKEFDSIQDLYMIS